MNVLITACMNDIEVFIADATKSFYFIFALNINNALGY